MLPRNRAGSTDSRRPRPHVPARQWVALWAVTWGLVWPLHSVAQDPASAPPDRAALHRPTAVPDRIVLTLTGDPCTTMAVTWRTDATVTQGAAQFCEAAAEPALADLATQVPARIQRLDTSLASAHYHTAVLQGLQPGRKYAYRVGDGVSWSAWNHFVTAAVEPEPFSFVYFGDAQNEIKSLWSRVVREAFVDAPRARFFLHAGDLVNRGNQDEEWGEWHEAGGWINARVPTVAAPGNHEYAKGADDRPQLTPHWRAQFEFPANGLPGLEESVYFFDYQGLRMVVLNSNLRHEEQARWLEASLTDNPARWTIAAFHHPILSAKAGRDNPELRAAWQPVLERCGVDLVLQGHDHTYARTGLVNGPREIPSDQVSHRRSAGTVYVVSVSGPKMYDLGWQASMRRAAEGVQLYQIIALRGDELRYEARLATGELYDAFRLQKRPGESNLLIEDIPPTPERRRAPP